MAYANELKQNLVRLASQMEGLTNKAKTENRGLTSAEREQFHALEADFSGIEDSIKIAEKTNSVVENLAKTPKTVISETQLEELKDTFGGKSNKKNAKLYDKTSYGKAFQNYIQHGQHTAIEDLNTMKVQNAQTITTSGGGYIIPVGFADEIDIATKWFGGIDGFVRVINTESGNPLQYPTVNDTGNKGRYLSVNTQVTETDIAFGQLTFNAYIASSDIVLVPLALVEDSYFDVNALIANLLGIRMGRLKNNACTVGNGSGLPTGVVNAAVTAGNVITAGGSSSSGEVASITYNDLVNLEHAVDPSYRTSSTWMFSDTMLKTIKKLVDGNARPLWQPGLTASFREGAGVDTLKPMILDHPYVVNNDVAVPAASAYSALFGDFSKYIVRQVNDKTLMVFKERYGDYLQIALTLFDRHDGNLVDAGTHPMAVFQQSAS